MATFDRSGLTQKAFDRQEGVNYHTFAYWVQQARLARLVPTPPVRFAELRLPGAPVRWLEVRLPDGTRVRGSVPADLAELVRGLRA